MFTGFQDYVRRTAAAVTGKAFVHTTDRTADQPYVQAVAGRPVNIGKTLDTSDDAARLTVVHSRVGSKKVRVYAEDGTSGVADFTIRTARDGTRVMATDRATAAALDLTEDILPANVAPVLKPLGKYIEADNNDTALNDADGDALPDQDTDGLDYADVVAAATKEMEVYSYSGGTMFVVATEATATADGETFVTFEHVDVTALAAPDLGRDPEIAGAHEQVQVKATIATAKAYEHIHFGVWAALGEATTAGQKLAGLGIGFVQNFSDSGVAERLGIGTVSYKGDWVGVIQRQNSAGAGAFNMGGGAATMTADFDMEDFEADLKGLAMLEGTLDGNGFSGMTATQISHADLDSTGTFTGEFSGNIYGEKGTEAAGVFDFAGGEAGSFRGAFGGTNQK